MKLVLLFFAACFAAPYPIVGLKDGNIMESVDFVYSLGFNMVYVPLQKTKDEYPRFVVSSNSEISKQTMLEYHKSKSSSNPLLGEFLGSTSDTIKTLLIPVKAPEDVDSIVHELSTSPRRANSFVLVIPDYLAYLKVDQTDAISRYRTLVPGGDVVLCKQDYLAKDGPELLYQAKNLEIDKIAVPIDSADAEFVRLSHLNNVTVGVFFADSKEQMKKAETLGVDFFTTQEPIIYLSLNARKSYKQIPKAHAAVFFG